MIKRLQNKAENARKGSGPKLRQQHPTPRHMKPEREVLHMPFEHDMGDSARKFNTRFAPVWWP